MHFSSPSIPHLTPKQVQAISEGLIVDVREPEEWDRVHVAGSRHLPLGELPRRWNELPRDRMLLMLCHHGFRSQRAAQFLHAKGFNVANIAGGIDRWALDVDPDMRRY